MRVRGWDATPGCARPLRRPAHEVTEITACGVHAGSGQVFGLMGTAALEGRTPTGRRFPGPGRSPVHVTAVVPTHRCGAVPDSHRVPSYDAPAWRAGRTDCKAQPRPIRTAPSAYIRMADGVAGPEAGTSGGPDLCTGRRPAGRTAAPTPAACWGRADCPNGHRAARTPLRTGRPPDCEPAGQTACSGCEPGRPPVRGDNPAALRTTGRAAPSRCYGPRQAIILPPRRPSTFPLSQEASCNDGHFSPAH